VNREPWDDWKAAWRETPPVDVARLRRHVDGKRKRMLCFVGLECLVSLLVLVHLGWRYATVNDGSLLGLIACGAFLVVATQLLMLALRRGAWRSKSTAPADLLRLTIRRCDIGRRLILAQWICSAVCLVAFGAWFALEYPALLESMGRDRLDFAIKVNIAAQIPVTLALAAWTAWYLPRLRRRREMAQRLLAELDGE